MDNYLVLLLLVVMIAMAVIGWRLMKRGKSQKRLSEKKKI